MRILKSNNPMMGKKAIAKSIAMEKDRVKKQAVLL